MIHIFVLLFLAYSQADFFVFSVDQNINICPDTDTYCNDTESCNHVTCDLITRDDNCSLMVVFVPNDPVECVELSIANPSPDAKFYGVFFGINYNQKIINDTISPCFGIDDCIKIGCFYRKYHHTMWLGFYGTCLHP